MSMFEIRHNEIQKISTTPFDTVIIINNGQLQVKL